MMYEERQNRSMDMVRGLRFTGKMISGILVDDLSLFTSCFLWFYRVIPFSLKSRV